MSCIFMQSTPNGNMNVHDDLKLNVFYCQTVLESFSFIEMFVYFSSEIFFCGRLPDSHQRYVSAGRKQTKFEIN